MTPEAKRLREQLLGLPESDRIEVAAALLASVGHDGGELSPADWERVWSAEADRRWQEIAAGRAETVPAADALRAARARLV